MRLIMLAIIMGFLFSLGAANAAELAGGSRVVIKAEGRKDYSPKIVNCQANSGICLRDTRYDPPENPVLTVADGQRVDFPSWKISYVFHSDGSGSVLDTSDKKVGSFTWAQ